MNGLEEIAKSSRKNAWITIYGALIIVSSLGYSYINLNNLEETVAKKTEELHNLESTVATLKNQAESYHVDLVKSEEKLKNLNETQNSILDFLVSVTNQSNIHILDPSVDWNEVKNQLNTMPAGDRKNALLNAILLAWKDIPFSMGKEGVTGFDSPRFLRYVLQSVGLEIKTTQDMRMSDTLMEKFIKVDKPKPGDLVFFNGQVGSFGFILLSVGSSDADHVGIGTLQKAAPLQIIKMSNINTPSFPLKGYYRVIYPDETTSNN